MQDIFHFSLFTFHFLTLAAQPIMQATTVICDRPGARLHGENYSQ